MEPAKINLVRDIVYGQGVDRRGSRHGRVKVIDLLGDLYRPDPPVKELRPGIVLIHGGSWERGTKGQQGWWGNPAVREGYVAFCPDHRLSYQDTFPGAVEDIKCSVRFLRKHADEYGIDPDRIAIAGGSSGAHLAMMTGLTPGRWEGIGGTHDQSSEVQAVVSIAGPTLLPALAWKGYVQRLMGGPISSIGVKRYLDASPYCHIHRGAPPLLMLHGTRDAEVPYLQSVSMLKLYRKGFGLNAELITHKGGKHGFMMNEAGIRKGLRQMFDWLRVALSLRELGSEE